MQGIDMNRDAAARQTPEAADPERPWWTGSNPTTVSISTTKVPATRPARSPKVATISFLATSYDYELSINDGAPAFHATHRGHE
jgi:hypothetical protein